MTEPKISIFDTLDTGLVLWKKHFYKIAMVGLIVYLPTQICIELVSIELPKLLSIEGNIKSIKLLNNIYESIRYLIGSVALLGILNFIILDLEQKEDKEQGIKEIILHGLKKWPDFIGAGFIAGLKILGHLLLLILPGIYKSVNLSFIDCVVATNDIALIDSCDESERIVKNSWWKTFGFLSLMFLLQFLFELLLIVPMILFSKSHVVTILIGVIVKIIETYFIVVRANYYFNLKMSKDVISTELNEETAESETEIALEENR